MSGRLPFALDFRVRDAAARALRKLRLDAGLTQTEVARRTGMHRPIVCRVERGVHAVSLQVAERFAIACGGSVLDVTRAIDVALGLVPNSNAEA